MTLNVHRHFVERGGLWVVGQGTLMLAVGVLGPFCRGEWRGSGLKLASTLLLLAAALCGIFGALALGRSLTPFPKPSSSTRLVQHGIYAFMRHPLYTAVISASLGWALYWASWPALAAAVALAFYFDAKARREERWLRQQFADYAAYERRVRRFVPWIY